MVNHGASVSRLGRTFKQRIRMLRNLVSNLVTHERIETTINRAKELRKVADHVITLGKKRTPAAKIDLEGILRTPLQVHKVMTELTHRYSERYGGYTRVLRTRRRKGDGAQMAFIEFIDRDGEIREARPAIQPPPSGASIGVFANHEESLKMIIEMNKKRPSPSR